MSKRFFLSVCACLAAGGLGAMQLSVDAVSQRYPWNGLVDISYTIGYHAGEPEVDALNERLQLEVTDNLTHTTHVAIHVNGLEPLPVSAGSYRVVWDANADGVNFSSTDVTVTLSVIGYAEKYMIVDVSEGSGATSYPVTYTDAKPPEHGYNADEYKSDKIVLRLIPPGTFVAGSPTTEKGRTAANEVQHRVVLTKPFYIGVFEVTQKQYKNVFGSEPSYYKGDYRPVETLSYNTLVGTGTVPGLGGTYGQAWPNTNAVQSTTFLGKLRARTSDLQFFLPTEAQWEYACRAGTTNDFNDGFVCKNADQQKERLNSLGRYKDNGGSTDYHTDVGSYEPNAWGLYDMHGNVGEHCCDWWRVDVENINQVVDPVGNLTVTKYGRTRRGGGYSRTADANRSASRLEMTSGNTALNTSDYGTGFRICLVPDAATDGNLATFETRRATASFSLSALDLSPVWEKTDMSGVQVLCSSLGWGVEAEEESGKTVTLALEPTDGSEDARTIASGISGYRVAATWTPSAVYQNVYRLTHTVMKGTTADASETLSAYFSFVNNPSALVTEATTDAAVLADTSQPFARANDVSHQWLPIDGAGSGLAAPPAVASVYTVTVAMCGTLSFEYCFRGGSFGIYVDGALAESPAVVSAFAPGAVTVGRGRHVIEFRATPAAANDVCIRNLRWAEFDGLLARDQVTQALDLSSVWEKNDMSAEEIAYSSLGWGLDAAADGGYTVSLTLAPVDGSAAAQTVAEGLTGHAQTHSWSPSAVYRTLYRMTHTVVKGTATNSAETLSALFSFENNPGAQVSAAEIQAAIQAEASQPYSFVNDPTSPWNPVGGAGEGIFAAPGAGSVFTVLVDGCGKIGLDYAFAGGTFAVYVDGVLAVSPGLAADWTALEVAVTARGAHTVEFRATPAAAGDVRMKALWWANETTVYSADDTSAAFDLRTGVRRVIRQDEILPFTYSQTNFTGLVGATAGSLAKVAIMRLEATGDDPEAGGGNDPAAWTNAANVVEGSYKVLYSGSAEDSVVWRPTRGVWKATYEILEAGETIHREYAILDLRRLREGFAIILR